MDMTAGPIVRPLGHRATIRRRLVGENRFSAETACVPNKMLQHKTGAEPSLRSNSNMRMTVALIARPLPRRRVGNAAVKRNQVAINLFTA